MNAQISFIDGHFSLIHIPLNLYSSFLQPILKALLPHDGVFSENGDTDNTVKGYSIHEKHGFLNISITPLECSIVCHKAWAASIFQPTIECLPRDMQNQVSISKDTYMVFSVSSAGMEAGQRVMDLTAPLAMAGIPIFFITTYYTDFILVPSKDHQTVVQALLARGFEFSESDSAYVAPTPISHTRGSSSMSSQPPSTPPPSNVAELQVRTFNQLKKRSVIPFIAPGLHLVQCSGKEISTSDNYSSRPPPNGSGSSAHTSQAHWLESIDPKLYLGLVSSFVLQPRFLSLTLSKEDAPSLLLDNALLPMFGDSIAGDTDTLLVPVFLDLNNLPLESTGIVCGVAGKLVEDMQIESPSGLHGSELSYLSTARAGAVILSFEGSAQAMKVLVPLLQREEDE